MIFRQANTVKLRAPEVDLSQQYNSNRYILTSMIESESYRLRAIQNELRARAASDPAIKAEWEALAMEWHALASAIFQGSEDIEQIEVA